MKFKLENHLLAEAQWKLKSVVYVVVKVMLKLFGREEKMSENIPGTTTTEEAPVKYPEQSPTRKDKPILIPVKPSER